MFFKVATIFVAALFGGLLVFGIRRRSWLFITINFIGMALNAAVLLLDVWSRLDMTILLAATPALAFVLAADIAILLREPRHHEKPAEASKDKPVVAAHADHRPYLLITNEKRFMRELEYYANLSSKNRDAALQFWRQGNEAFQQRRYQEAEGNYEKSIKVASAPSCLNNLAAVLIATNRAEAALQRCREACAVDSELLEAWVNRGSSLLLLKRTKEAIACFDQAVSSQPNMLEPWIFRGNALIQAGQLEQSIACYETALSLNPNRPECWNNRGVALSKMGELQEAKTSFERALKIRPGYFPASLNHVLVIDKLGQFNQAKLHYRNFLKQAPSALNGQLVFVRSRLHQLENGVAGRVDLNQLEPELAK